MFSDSSNDSNTTYIYYESFIYISMSLQNAKEIKNVCSP